MTDDTALLRAQLLDDLPSPYDGELDVLLSRGRRSRRRRRAAMAGSCVATLGIAGVAAGFALSAMQPSTRPSTAVAGQDQHSCGLVACVPGAIGARIPDPSTGRPFATAAEASAAGGGFYVPDCPGHGTYYLQPNGSVVTFFDDRAAVLMAAPPSAGYIFGPIQGNSVVTPRELTAQGQVAYGYEATPRIVRVSPTRQEGVLVHSLLTWTNRGSVMEMSSATKWSLADLQHLADSCT